MTPLLFACSDDPSFFIIQQLIELGADVSARDYQVSQYSHSSLVF